MCITYFQYFLLKVPKNYHIVHKSIQIDYKFNSYGKWAWEITILPAPVKAFSWLSVQLSHQSKEYGNGP